MVPRGALVWHLSKLYTFAVRLLDAGPYVQTGSPGPVESELNTYNSKKVLDLVAGAYSELHSAFHAIIDLIASQLADGNPRYFDVDHGTCTCMSNFLQQAGGAWDSHCTAGGLN